MDIRISPAVLKFILVVLLLRFALASSGCSAGRKTIPHETDKSKFYKCSDTNKKIEMHCPYRTLFNPSAGFCENVEEKGRYMKIPLQQRPPFYPDAPFHSHMTHSFTPSENKGINKGQLMEKHPSGFHGSSTPTYRRDIPYHGVNSKRSSPYYFTGSHYPSKPFFYKPAHLGTGYLQPYHPHHHTIDYNDEYGENNPYNKPYSDGSYSYPNFGTRTFVTPMKHAEKSKFNTIHSHHGNRPYHYGSPRA